MGVQYYRLEPRAFTLGECWRLVREPFAFLTVLLCKWGLKTWNFPVTLSAVDSWPEIDPADMLPDAAARIDRAVAELEALGCSVVAFGSIPQIGFNQHHHAVLLLSTDRYVGVAVTDFVSGHVVESIVGLTTRYHDGTFGITINARNVFTVPANQLHDHCPGLGAAEVYERHRSNLERWQTGGHTAGTFEPREASIVAAQLSQESAEHLEDRGIFVRLTEDEIDDRRDNLRRR